MTDLENVLTHVDRTELKGLCGARVRFDEPLAQYTWWKVGGPADALIDVQTEAELAQLLEFCRRRAHSFFLLGNGSNVLVGDGGIRGLVLRLVGEFTAIEFIESAESPIRVTAGGGASLALLTGQAASRGAQGVDGLAGVPATLGGAVRMNAGTDREIGEFVRRVWVQSLSRPQAHEVSLQYVYRRSTLQPEAIIARVELEFSAVDSQHVRAVLQERLIRRKATQPVALPNAGSCFRNPPGDRAGRLIEAVGAKGWRVGDAEVSTLHANFIVNLGQASAENIAVLLARVQAAVFAQFAITLELEIHFVGVFTAAPVVA